MTVVELSWLETGLLLLTPALALAVALLLGRYPGEKRLVRSRRRTARRRRPAVPGSQRLDPVLHVCGGLLLGHSRAGRAPPELSSCLS
jgi:hypothetical protein